MSHRGRCNWKMRPGGQLWQWQHCRAVHPCRWITGPTERGDPASGLQCGPATSDRSACAFHRHRRGESICVLLRSWIGQGADLSPELQSTLADPKRSPFRVSQVWRRAAAPRVSSQRPVRLRRQRDGLELDGICLRSKPRKIKPIADRLNAAANIQWPQQLRGSASPSIGQVCLRLKSRP